MSRPMGPRKKTSRSSTSLVAVLHALQGRQLIFELRNDVTVSGTITSVDEYMNLFIDNALWQPTLGPAKPYPFLFVKGRNLRMVQLPTGFDAAAAIDTYIEDLKKQRVTAALQLLNKRHERLGKGSLSAEAGAATGAASDD
eukprot:GHRR01016059.1.p1 GENE.GHRR01016059.1~~GHRR01016059.1.p1  ORF type:complete len:141 (+),score=52.20 GHRR01016059.1:255-677(+)